jgi:predicted ArsR family transcriptional regulator
MMTRELRRQIGDIATLDEPVRRALYAYVAGRTTPVSRDEAARAVHVTRALAAFHLDKLVAAKLLEASYRRLKGRSGPGAGRPAKLYRRSDRQLDMSLPARRYELAARLLSQGLSAVPDAITADAIRKAAQHFGGRLAEQARRKTGPHAKRARLLGNAEMVLRSYGFDPARTDQLIRLRNCPFDAVARDYRGVVCKMNLAVMQGFAKGLGRLAMRAERDPQPGQCCVALRLGRKTMA